MSTLSVITIDNNQAWDTIIRSFKRYDVYYLSGYLKSFQIHGDGEPNLFYYEDSNLRAVNVVMKRDIKNDENFTNKLTEGCYFDLTTPYGYGGFLIEGELTNDSLRKLDDQYSSFCKSKGILSEFVRFQPLLRNNEAVASIYDILVLGKTISMNLESREQIWLDLTSKNRNMLRKAQNAGVKIFWGRSADLYSEFIQLYNATMDKDKAKDYYYFGNNFYDIILNDFKYNALMFYADYLGKTIAMSIILFANKLMHYHLSATEINYKHLAPTNLLLYEAACWGNENGYKIFHLGGGLGSNQDSLYKFKSAFNRNSENVFTVGSKIFDEEKYEQLVEMRKTEVLRMNEAGVDTKLSAEATSGYFPKYRAKFELIGENEYGNEKK